MMFSFCFLCSTGDDSVNAGGLDVTAAVAFAVVASVVASVVAVASAIASVVVVIDSAAASVVGVALFWGGWGFLPLRLTWVHPSLLGWSSGSRSELLGEVAAVSVVVAVGLVVFWGQDLAKWPNSLQAQQSGFLPATTTFIFWSLLTMTRGMAGNSSLFRFIFIM